jgi:ATP-dependent Lon protease
MLAALVSMLTNRRVRHDVAMSGEITLRGAILPVGGVKEKVLAAHRAGIKRVVLPDRNRKDLDDVPDQAREELDICFIKRMDEVLELVLEPKSSPEKAAESAT